MSASFDPYVQWLSIADPQRPPNHYQLIGLAPFSDDPQAISAAADAALLRVRAIQPRENAAEWQQVLDELSIARLTLTNPLRKLQYDAQLRASLAEAAASPAPSAAAPLTAKTEPVPTQPSAAWQQPAQQVVPRTIDPNLFPPGAVPAAVTSAPAPTLVRPAAASVAAPPVIASPVAVPFVQSYAMPPVHVAPEAYVAPAVVPVVQSVSPQIVQASVAMPTLMPTPSSAATPSSTPTQSSSPQSPQSRAIEPARVIETVSMPPLGVREQPAARAAVAAGIAKSAAIASQPDFEVPLFMPDPTSRSTADSPVETAATFQPAAAAQSLPASSPATHTSPEAIFVVHAYLSNKTHKSTTGAFIGGTAAVVVVVVVGIFLTSGRKRAPDDDSTAVAHAPAVVPGPATSDKPVPRLPAHKTNDNVRPVESRAELPSDQAPTDEAPADNETNKARPVIADEPEPKPAPIEPQPGPTKPADPAAEPPADPPKQPTPEITPTTPEAKPAVDPEKAAAFARSVKVARAALGARNLPKARQEIEAAIAVASTPQQHDQAERLRLLLGYVEEFWTNVGKALKDLQPTDEIKIGSTTAAVVESDPTSITIHVAGKNLSYKLAEMPVGLVIALADRWFDAKNPTTKVFYGAFHAADAKGDPKEARRLWEEAGLSGVATTELLPLLDEGAAVLVAEQGPVPDAKHLAAAEKNFKAAYQQELRTAKSPQRKLELAKKFVDVAMTTEDPAERYVLFNESYKIASEGGNPPGILRAVDEMAKWYKVDGLELKTAALAKAGTSTSNSLVAKAVARSSLELLDQALSDKRLEHAGKLSQAALAAAKKSKDPALVKQAIEREQQVRELIKDKPADNSAG